jgi:hypothetical protein
MEEDPVAPMRLETTIAAKVGEGVLPLDESGRQELATRLADLRERFLVTTATNRLEHRDYANNRYVEKSNDDVQWDLRPDALVAAIETDGEEQQEHARLALHWLKVAWAAAWTNHRHVPVFARPFSSLDVTITIDPATLIGSEGCSCRLCACYEPRLAKWGAKRVAASEVYRRIGEGESVQAGEVLPFVGANNIEASGKKAPKKSAMLTAEEAKEWLALNPKRAF